MAIQWPTSPMMDRLKEGYGHYTLLGSTKPEQFSRLYKADPAIRSCDLCGFDPVSYSDLDNQITQKQVDDAIEWARETEGITYVHIHWPYPLGPGSSWLDGHGRHPATDQFSLQKAMVAGTRENSAIVHDIDHWASYLKQFKDARLEILFRPLHEMQGGWFWWNCTTKGGNTPEEFAQFWRFLHNRLTKVHELDNLWWVFAMAERVFGHGIGKDGEGLQLRKDSYPGDEYVDIIGADIYNAWEDPRTDNWISIRNLCQAVAPNKPIAIAECGTLPNLKNSWKPLFAFDWHSSERTAVPYADDPPYAGIDVWTGDAPSPPTPTPVPPPTPIPTPDLEPPEGFEVIWSSADGGRGDFAGWQGKPATLYDGSNPLVIELDNAIDVPISALYTFCRFDEGVRDWTVGMCEAIGFYSGDWPRDVAFGVFDVGEPMIRSVRTRHVVRKDGKPISGSNNGSFPGNSHPGYFPGYWHAGFGAINSHVLKHPNMHAWQDDSPLTIQSAIPPLTKKPQAGFTRLEIGNCMRGAGHRMALQDIIIVQGVITHKETSEYARARSLLYVGGDVAALNKANRGPVSPNGGPLPTPDPDPEPQPEPTPTPVGVKKVVVTPGEDGTLIVTTSS